METSESDVGVSRSFERAEEHPRVREATTAADRTAQAAGFMRPPNAAPLEGERQRADETD
jgi:hypothetical protein